MVSKVKLLSVCLMVQHTVHFRCDRSTKKYNIDIDAEHDHQSLWGLMIKYIDTQGPKSHHATAGKLKR